jgi:hypothetical protein
MIGEVSILTLLPALSRNANANGSAVDLSAYVNVRAYKAYLDVGNVTGTSPTLDVKIQESDDGTTFTDISGAAFAQMSATGNQTLVFKTGKRYVRAVATLGGSSPVFVCGAYLLAVAERA